MLKEFAEIEEPANELSQAAQDRLQVEFKFLRYVNLLREKERDEESMDIVL